MRLAYLTIGMVATLTGAALHRAAAPAPSVSTVTATPPCGPRVAIRNTARDSRCFELRTYTLVPGGSADLLHARFRDRTMALFKKHGMTVIGFWQPVARLDQVVYMLAFRDAAARDSAWAAFNADPDWIKAHAQMKVSVDVDNTFMVATDYSPMK